MSDLIEIDLQIVQKHVRRIASKNPRYVYSGVCQYTYCDTEDPESFNGCLVGRAIIAAYPHLKQTLRNLDINSNKRATDIQSLDDIFSFKNKDSLNWLKKVQMLQDSGSEWASAILESDKKETTHE